MCKLPHSGLGFVSLCVVFGSNFHYDHGSSVRYFYEKEPIFSYDASLPHENVRDLYTDAYFPRLKGEYFFINKENLRIQILKQTGCAS